jgi:hypothetical protein
MPLTATSPNETEHSNLSTRSIRFSCFEQQLLTPYSIHVPTYFGDSAGESTSSTMKKGYSGTNDSDLNKDDIIKPTHDRLLEEDHKALKAYHKEVDEIFLSRYEVTWQVLIQKDATQINICKSEITPEVRSNPSLSLDDVQVMINSALQRQAKSSNELMHRLMEERDGKIFVNPNVHVSSSSCVVNFAQTNPQPGGASVGSTSQPNPSAQPMNHFYSQTTIDGSAQAYGMPHQTMSNMFGQGYVHAAPRFSMPNLGSVSYTPGSNG